METLLGDLFALSLVSLRRRMPDSASAVQGGNSEVVPEHPIADPGLHGPHSGRYQRPGLFISRDNHTLVVVGPASRQAIKRLSWREYKKPVTFPVHEISGD